MIDRVKFLGLSKPDLLVVVLVVSIMMAAVNGITLAFAILANNHRISDNRALALENLRHDCAQRSYAKAQVDATQDFLDRNPGNLGLGTITRDQLEAQLDRQKSFLATYDGLDCRIFGGKGPVK